MCNQSRLNIINKMYIFLKILWNLKFEKKIINIIQLIISVNNLQKLCILFKKNFIKLIILKFINIFVKIYLF